MREECGDGGNGSDQADNRKKIEVRLAPGRPLHDLQQRSTISRQTAANSALVSARRPLIWVWVWVSARRPVNAALVANSGSAERGGLRSL
jgi:hypothetical protein